MVTKTAASTKKSSSKVAKLADDPKAKTAKPKTQRAKRRGSGPVANASLVPVLVVGALAIGTILVVKFWPEIKEVAGLPAARHRRPRAAMLMAPAVAPVGLPALRALVGASGTSGGAPPHKVAQLVDPSSPNTDF